MIKWETSVRKNPLTGSWHSNMFIKPVVKTTLEIRVPLKSTESRFQRDSSPGYTSHLEYDINDNRSKRPHRRNNRSYVSSVVLDTWPFTLEIGIRNKDWLRSTRSKVPWEWQGTSFSILTCRTNSKVLPIVQRIDES